MTDREIIDHLKEDKYSAALKGLYNVLPPAKKYICDNSGSPTDADDIFQDALVILYRKVKSGSLILSVPLKTYLMAVVRNCWLQELRRRQKLPSSPAMPEDLLSENDADESAYSMAEEAFRSLGEKCKQLLTMFYFNKQSFRAIAAALSFGDEKTAKNQKYRCLQKAKEYYLTISKSDVHG